MAELPLFNSIVLLVIGAVLTFLSAAYWMARAEKKALLARVVELERLNSLVTQAVVPISAAFQAILIKELTHFHTPIMDALMVKLGPPNTLTTAEEVELVAALKQREQDMDGLIDDAERDAARMLPMVMKRVKAESESPNMETTIQVVARPGPKTHG